MGHVDIWIKGTPASHTTKGELINSTEQGQQDWQSQALAQNANRKLRVWN